MTSFHIRTAALLVAGIVLTAGPSFAQRGDRRNGEERGRPGVERAQPRGGNESRERRESQGRVEPRGRADSERRVEPRERTEPRGRLDHFRGYDNRTFGNRFYRPYGNRSYVLPYGYRPHGYRPGWSLDFYFGRPYSAYGYPAYGPSAGYGYYAPAPGRAYGAVRIVDAPRDAQVFVDGYYAGVVDDYDGVFQHLNLEAGPHHLEIEEQGYLLVAFDVRVEPGQTITYRANIR